MKKTGTRLRAWREWVGWTQPQAADHFNVSLAYWRLIETGGVTPSEEIRTRLEAAFCEPFDALVKHVDVRKLPTMRTEVPA